MQEFIENSIQPHFNYWIYVVLMMIGFWALIAKRNLIKKMIGLSIFQTAIILFFVSLGVKENATIPILVEDSGKAGKGWVAPEAGDHGPEKKSKFRRPVADDHVNPLPQVLMLTAIVVGVANLGVALSISQGIYRSFGTLEEDEILRKIKNRDYHD